ncbi:MAG: hypothetical protein LBJ63_00040 [Prevotellaceae bacterium]|jgi:hypothetical protein|nr:hypothetical protein [Prevotellaceae bacterium]
MKGILFTEPMFHKVVSGEKVMTRRIIKPQPGKDLEIPEEGFINFDGEYCFGRQRVLIQTVECRYDDNGKLYQHYSEDIDVDVVNFPVKPRYKPGETLYLKEPYWSVGNVVQYKYSCGNGVKGFDVESIKWSNKLFMPEKHARYFIEITGVRCERLQNIGDEDCLKEGIEEQQWTDYPYNTFYVIPDTTCELYNAPQEAYAALIDSINGKGTWNSNPFVWCYSFKLIK